MMNAPHCGQVRRNCASFAFATTAATTAVTAVVITAILAARSAVSNSTRPLSCPVAGLWRLQFNLLDPEYALDSTTAVQVRAPDARASNAPRLACVGRRVAVNLLLSAHPLSPSSRSR